MNREEPPDTISFEAIIRILHPSFGFFSIILDPLQIKTFIILVEIQDEKEGKERQMMHKLVQD